MNFDFSDEQKQIKDQARKFLSEKCTTKTVLGSRAEHLQASVYTLPGILGEQFDIVLFLGVLYHLRHQQIVPQRLPRLHDAHDGGVHLMSALKFDGLVLLLVPFPELRTHSRAIQGCRRGRSCRRGATLRAP